jgi:DNA replication and repair protein RecF
MGFDEIRLFNFRNLEDTTLSTNAESVFLIGENGQGKSNFLESVYLLCFGSSFRKGNDRVMIRHQAEEATVFGNFHDQIDHSVAVQISTKKKKRIELNGKTLPDRKELLYRFPAILFCHDDMYFVDGPPERRRWFMNQTNSLIDARYYDALKGYNHILKERNQILKNRDYNLLPVYNEQLVQYGLKICSLRNSMIQEFSNLFQELFKEVSMVRTPVKVEYRPSWPLGAERKVVLSILDRCFENDKRMQTSTRGPHRDKFIFLMDGKDFQLVGSTGQKRLAALILRIAQAQFYTRTTGKKPLLFFDDVLLELDQQKRERFIAALPEYLQAFFTFLPDEPYARYARSGTLIYRLEQGRFTAQ